MQKDFLKRFFLISALRSAKGVLYILVNDNVFSYKYFIFKNVFEKEKEIELLKKMIYCFYENIHFQKCCLYINIFIKNLNSEILFRKS